MAPWNALNFPFDLAFSTTSIFGINESTIEMPAETIFLADAAITSSDLNNGNPVRHPTFDASYMAWNPYAHGRHNGSASVGWGDGHAKAQKVDIIPFTMDVYGSAPYATKENLNRFKLGQILKYPRFTTTLPADTVGNPKDWYYYRMSKKGL